MYRTAMAFLAALVFSVSILAADKPSGGKQGPKININEATIEQLDEGLLGVGKRIATEIVKHRESNGPFENLDDLDRVKFVGSKVLEKNKDRIVFDK